jgi:transcriptional regulator with XRE-family HTH domain
MNVVTVPLATRLRERRSQLGLTQSQAARQLDVARTAYRLWEMDAATPAADRWRGIANWLQVPVDVILPTGDEGADEPRTGSTFWTLVGADRSAPRQGRAVVDAVASGLSPAVARDARLLVSELLSDVVQDDGERGSIELGIDVDAERFRAEVRSAASAPTRAGQAPLFLAKLASRWGGEVIDGRRTAWFELSLKEGGGS